MWKTLRKTETKPIDYDVVEESSLAMAQAIIYQAMRESNLKKADLAHRLERPRSFITRILSGSHNLTVKTFARAMAACGYELRFEKRPMRWGWVEESTYVVQTGHNLPAPAGSPMLAAIGGVGLPAGEVAHAALARRALAENRDHCLGLGA